MNLFKLLLVAGLSLQVTVLSMMAMEKDEAPNPETEESEYDLCSKISDDSFVQLINEEGGGFVQDFMSRPISCINDKTIEQEAKKRVTHGECKSLNFVSGLDDDHFDRLKKWDGEAYFPCLKRLRLEGHTLKDLDMLMILLNCPELEKLDLWNCKITDAVVKNIADYGKNIKALGLFGRDQVITDDAIIDFVNKHKEIKALGLSGSGITDAAVITIAQTCKDIESFCLFESGITNAALEAMAADCRNLQYLGFCR